MGAQLVVKIAETFGVDLPLRTLFAMPTVRQLAREIESRIIACAAAYVKLAQILTGEQLTEALKLQAGNAPTAPVLRTKFGAAMVDYCVEHDLPVFPGVATPTELEFALSRGLSLVRQAIEKRPLPLLLLLAFAGRSTLPLIDLAQPHPERR
jgi:2-keto-3-deoxy-6-phosphogluconate aldolase